MGFLYQNSKKYLSRKKKLKVRSKIFNKQQKKPCNNISFFIISDMVEIFSHSDTKDHVLDISRDVGA